MLLVMKTLEGERFVDIKAYKFTIFEILRDCHILRVSPSLHVESTTP